MSKTPVFASATVVAGLALSLFAPDAKAHEPVAVAVGVPPVVVSAGGVHVAVGMPPPPPPPPPVVVMEEPRADRVIVVRERVNVPERTTIVYVDDDDDDCRYHKHPRGKAWGYWKKHGHHRH